MDENLEKLNKKQKDFKDFKWIQTGLFDAPVKSTEPETKSSSIELYDAIPKYFWGTASQPQDTDPIERPFMFRNEMLIMRIFPTKIKDAKGIYRTRLPGEREEIIEDALRKMASSQNHGCFLDGLAGVTFTLYQLRKELKRMGHTYSSREIIEALDVCNQTHIKVETASGQKKMGSSLFETVGVQTKEERKDQANRTHCFVRFNLLVTSSIKERTFRQINYEQCMRYKMALARWIHKRISHLFIQASIKETYTIGLFTIIRDSGMKQYDEIRNNVREIKKALDEMKNSGVLTKYDIDLRKNGRKIADALFTLYPGPSFIREMKEANKISQVLQPQLPDTD